MRVELADLGVAGTVEVADVEDGELIEIDVETSDASLAVAVIRRASPRPAAELPATVTENNVTIQVPA